MKEQEPRTESIMNCMYMYKYTHIATRTIDHQCNGDLPSSRRGHTGLIAASNRRCPHRTPPIFFLFFFNFIIINPFHL